MILFVSYSSFQLVVAVNHQMTFFRWHVVDSAVRVRLIFLNPPQIAEIANLGNMLASF